MFVHIVRRQRSIDVAAHLRLSNRQNEHSRRNRLCASRHDHHNRKLSSHW